MARWKVQNATGKGPGVDEEFEGDEMTCNLKVDTLIRMTGDGTYSVKRISELSQPGLDAADPKASDKSSTAKAGVLEDPHTAGIPQRASPVLAPTPATLPGDKPEAVTSKAAEKTSPAAKAQDAQMRNVGLTAPPAQPAKAPAKRDK